MALRLSVIDRQYVINHNIASVDHIVNVGNQKNIKKDASLVLSEAGQGLN